MSTEVQIFSWMEINGVHHDIIDGGLFRCGQRVGDIDTRSGVMSLYRNDSYTVSYEVKVDARRCKQSTDTSPYYRKFARSRAGKSDR